MRAHEEVIKILILFQTMNKLPRFLLSTVDTILYLELICYAYENKFTETKLIYN